jgi:hypothetical protein
MVAATTAITGGGIEMNAVVDFKQKANAAGAILPCICIDIETANADQAVIDQELAFWSYPSNWKPETVEKNRAAHAIKVSEKSALLDSAPVATVGICDDQGDAVVFHWLLMDTGARAEGYHSQQSANEREMLIAFRDWANACTDEASVIVGFNLGFDLPHLRIAYTRHGLKLPRLLAPRSGNPIADVMYLFTKYFTSKDAVFIGLDEVVKRLGIAPEGKQLDGSDVPVYVAKGFEDGDIGNALHQDVITYNAIDVLVTMRAFLICTGQAGD